MSYVHFNIKYLPFNKTALEREPRLKSRIQGWVGTKEWKVATTSDWFHGVSTISDWFHGVFQDPNRAWIWAPPPVLAKIEVEQMCEAKHIFPNSKHVFVCPSLMTGSWRKQLGKLADTMITITARKEGVWTKEMYEPLTVAFVRPLLSERPWKAGRLNRVSNWERKMRKVQWTDTGAIWNHMRQFWLLH
jgi:hypothetical protein